MEVTGDASSHLYGALASGLGAMHRLSVDTGLMMQTCQVEMAKYRLGDGDTENLTERVARDATSKLPWAIDRLVAQRVWRIALIAAGVLVGTNLLTAGGMYLWLQATLTSLARCGSNRIGRGALAQPDRGQPRRSGQPGAWPVQSSTKRRHGLRVLFVDDSTGTAAAGMTNRFLRMPTDSFACAVPHACTQGTRSAYNPAINPIRDLFVQVRSTAARTGTRCFVSPRRVVRAFLATCHPSRIALQNSHSRLASDGWQLDRCGKKSSQTACPYGVTRHRQ
jgi:hypothetical protein